MSGELKGSGNVPVYHLKYHGGTKDGQVYNVYKPFFEIKDDSTGELYKVKDLEDYIEWESDFTYTIHLYLQND